MNTDGPASKVGLLEAAHDDQKRDRLASSAGAAGIGLFKAK